MAMLSMRRIREPGMQQDGRRSQMMLRLVRRLKRRSEQRPAREIYEQRARELSRFLVGREHS
jgi:hypothetical protein